MLRRAAFLLLAAGFLGAAPAWALASSSPEGPGGILSFAEALRAVDDSYRAATEYLRFLHHFPDDPEAARALEGLGRAYASAGRWGEAAGAFSRLAEVNPGEQARRLLGGALYQGGYHADAARVLLAPGAAAPDAVLGTLALLRAGRTADLPEGARADLAQEYEDLTRKSPGLAAGLSAVLPGAGHLYAGRPRDAAVALLLNGAFLWGTYESARREEWALAGILGAFEVGWYAGTLTSSMNAAYKWNRREEGLFFHRWEEGSLPRWNLVLAPGVGGAGLAWSW